MVADPPTHPQTDRTDYDTLRRSFASASMEKCMCVHVRCSIPYRTNPLQCPHHHIQVAHYRSTLVYLPPANLRNSLICQISKEMNSGRLTKYYGKAVTVIRMMISLVYFSRYHSRLGLVPPKGLPKENPCWHKIIYRRMAYLPSILQCPSTEETANSDSLFLLLHHHVQWPLQLNGSVKEPNISIYFFFPPIIQRCSISDVLFTGGRGVSDFSVLKYY